MENTLPLDVSSKFIQVGTDVPKKWMQLHTPKINPKKAYLGWMEHWWLQIQPTQENSQHPAMKFTATTPSRNSLAKFLGPTAPLHLLKNTLHLLVSICYWNFLTFILPSAGNAPTDLMEVPSSWSIQAKKTGNKYMLNHQKWFWQALQ